MKIEAETCTQLGKAVRPLAVWIPNGKPSQCGYMCSYCKFTDKGIYSRRFHKYPRCPWCGTLMSGVAKWNNNTGMIEVEVHDDKRRNSAQA